jgi:hypothetical protein
MADAEEVHFSPRLSAWLGTLSNEAGLREAQPAAVPSSMVTMQQVVDKRSPPP